MVGDPCCHCGSSFDGLMDAAEIVKGNIKRNSRLEIFKLFREATKVHTNTQIGAFHMRRRDVGEIRPADFDMWDRRHNITAAIPPVATALAVDFPKLGEVHVLFEVLAHRPDISVVLVGCDLISAIRSSAEIGHEGMGVNASATANVVRDDEGIRALPKRWASAQRVRGLLIQGLQPWDTPTVNLSSE